MKINKISFKSHVRRMHFALALILIVTSACNNPSEKSNELTFEQQVEDYLQKFPYQETYEYMLKYTGGDPKQLNKIFPGSRPVLEKAGTDRVVRSNNDTYYSGGFVYLSNGPVKLSASEHDDNRFYSFQLMDDRNVNFKNIIRPKGNYYLYHGEKPENIKGEAIESPSLMVVVIMRVEVKDKTDLLDVGVAQKVFNGLNIQGPEISNIPAVDVLSSFDEKVVKRANEMMDSTFKHVPFYKLVPSAEQLPDEVPYLYLAASTKDAWGAPVAAHSTYQMIHHDSNNEVLNGSKANYTLTTEEPNVGGFWSVTVYDTDRGGFLHPNKDDLYHINNASAVRNEDGTITFLFKTQCEEGDINCLEVPAGNFDLTVRYYLPDMQLQKGQWQMPNPKRLNN